MAISLNDVAMEIHKNAVEHGWWEEERELPEILMLCVSELAEALEEYRNGKPNLYSYCQIGDNGMCYPAKDCKYEDTIICKGREGLNFEKPEGVAIELADCIIRILDYCGKAGIDIENAIYVKHEYNKSRPYRHGGKKC